MEKHFLLNFLVFDNQCDHIGRFLKLLSTIFETKVAQIFGYFSGLYQEITLEVKSAWTTFWPKFGQNWATFNSTSGRTVDNRQEA